MSTTALFVDELRKLKARSGLSYRGIERAARRLGDVLPASTVSSALNRDSLPSADLLRSLVRACGGSDEDVLAWMRIHQATSELVAARGATAQPAASDGGGFELSPAPPCLLPPKPPRLIGRTQESRQVEAVLTSPRDNPIVLIITGSAGVGKTTFAVHCAHRVKDRYPDGQLYAHLQGAGGRSAEPAAVITGFLRALGVASPAIPTEYTERLNLYRTMTARRRILIVLDDAADSRQVRDLIPTGEGCAVIITSRASLASLDGTRRPLATLSTEDAVELLADMVGHDRVRRQPEAARAIVGRCDRLPLAVWIAGARLAARPHLPLSSLADQLGDAQRQLDVLAVGEVAVRASFELTYQRLPDAARRVLRLLSLVPNDFCGWAVAALMDTTLDKAERQLDELVEVHLLDAAGECGRHRMHDLVRVFAAERCEAEDDGGVRDVARERMLGAAIQLADAAESKLSVDFRGSTGYRLDHWRLAHHEVERQLAVPLDWFDSERRFLLHLAADAFGNDARRPAAGPAAHLAAYLAVSLTSCLQVGCHFEDWLQLQSAALTAVTAAGDNVAATRLHRSLGELATILDRYDEAVAHFEQALRLGTDDEDPDHTASVLAGLAYVHRLAGRYDEASSLFAQAAHLAQRTDNRNCLVYALNGMGTTAVEQGDLSSARTRFHNALELSRQSSYRPGEAQALRSLGMLHRLTADNTAAARCLETAHQLSLGLGDRVAAAHASCWLGDVLVRAGQTDRGRAIITESLWVFREFGNSWGEAASLTCLAEADLVDGDSDAALVRATRAMQIWRRIGSPYWLANGLATLGKAHRARGEKVESSRAAAEASLLRGLAIF